MSHRIPTSLIYGSTVVLWGCAFIAIANMVSVMAPETSVIYRNGVCAILILGWHVARRRRLKLGVREHALVALQALLMYVINDVFTFNAVTFITSGLVALVISMVMILNVLFGALFLGLPIRPRVVLAAVLGIGGVALVFWHDLVAFDLSSDGVVGLGMALASAAVFSLGQMIGARNAYAGVPLAAAMGMAMAYGTVFALVIAVVLGRPLAWSWSPIFLASFFYIAVIGTLLGFFMYFTVLARMGPDRAAYISVLTPVVALVVSTIFESFVWTPLSLAGAAVILVGNLLVIAPGRAASAA